MVGTPTIVASGFWQGTSHPTASHTYYFGLSCRGMIFTDTESWAQQIARAAGDFTRLGIKISSNTSAAAMTLRFRKDTGGGGANGNNSASVTASTTGFFEDATPHTDTVAAGDKFNASLTSGAGSTALTANFGIAKHQAATSSVWYPGFGGYGNFSFNQPNITTDSITNATPIGGGDGSTAGVVPEAAQFQTKFRAPGTMSHIHINVTINSRITTCTFLLRKNSATVNGTASVSAAATGFFEDVTNSDSIATTNTADWGITTSTGGGNFTFITECGMFVGSGTGFEAMAANLLGPTGNGSTSASNYYGLWGPWQPVTVQATAQCKVPFASTTSYMRAYVMTANTGALTAHFQKNGSNANQALSITSATTGLFEDTVNTDNVADGDNLNYETGAMASIFSFTVSYWGLLMDPGGGGGGGGASQTHRYNTVILG